MEYKNKYFAGERILYGLTDATLMVLHLAVVNLP